MTEQSTLDYQKLWDRWTGLMMLPETDYKHLLTLLHEEMKAGIEFLGTIVGSEGEAILKDISFSKKKEYLKALVPLANVSALFGYLLFLMTKGVNPDEANLSRREETKGLGAAYMEQFQKDQNASYIRNISPLHSLFLEKVYELRVNQLVAAVPESVDLPYKVIEGIHQYLRWSAHQGFVLGMMEEQLGSHERKS